MKNSWKYFALRAVGLGNPENRLARAMLDIRRNITGSDRKFASHYLDTTDEPKLHIGGGPRCLDGWLNADLNASHGVIKMDATLPFPFPDASFAYLFTEHMIEHVPYEGGAAMLRECFRVLREGGAIRVVTPDLTSLAALCGPSLSDLQKQYLEWFCGACLPKGRKATPAEALNANFRFWGHQFIYDEVTLTDALYKAGFREIRRQSLMKSPYEPFRNLENIDRYPEGFLELESLALEARK